MNLHQVLTGATNAEASCYAVGSVEGKHFTAYAAGFNIVILDGNFSRVQIISGTEHGHTSEITCISCCSDIGKIAASYQSKIVIYEPAPVVRLDSNKTLLYQWFLTGSLQLTENVICLTWNLEGSTFLTSSGNLLQMWQGTEATDENREENADVDFTIGEDEEDVQTEMYEWTCIWETTLANPATMIKFSSDGTLFATVGEDDRLVKIWYENIRCVYDTKMAALNFSFFYLCHPKAVTEISWRRTSKYMQRGVIANILMTSCKDGICRIWSETFLPEDGIIDCRLSDAGITSSKQAQHHKRRIVQRLSHIRRLLHKRKRKSTDQATPQQLASPSENNKDAFSNESHKYGHMNSVNLTLHFHLSASIDFGSDIPTISSFVNGCSATNFVTHWLNNKEFQATFEAERILDEMNLRYIASSKSTPNNILSPTDSTHNGMIVVGSETGINDKFVKESTGKLFKAKTTSNFDSEKNSPLEPELQTLEFKDIEVDPTEHKMEQLVRDWNESLDILFSIHPIDGSLLIWTVHYLDESSPGIFRQAQICFNSRLPGAFPICDATTMMPNIWLYCDYGRINLKNLMHAVPKNKSEMMESFKQERKDYLTTPHIVLLTKHTNGSLNLWHMHFSEGSNFSNTTIVTHVARASGHRFHAYGATCHPVLPLLLTTSHLRLAANIRQKREKSQLDDICGSELILWRVVPVSPLSYSGGIFELARINSTAKLAFENVAWIPTILPVNSLGSNSPSALFVGSNGQMLRIYHAVLDALSLLHNVKPKTQRLSMEEGEMEDAAFEDAEPNCHLNIVSDQSTSRPGCIIDLMPIKDANQAWSKIKLIHIFQERMIKKNESIYQSSTTFEAFIDLQNASKFNERFYLVVMEIREKKICIMHMWCITIASTDYDGETINTENLLSPFIHISTEKIGEEQLPLSSDIRVTSAAVAAGHLSSSSIYPACYAPYIISTACSDGQVYFWRCDLEESFGKKKVSWSEWKMMASPDDSSTIPIIGFVLSISCAYNGRVAIAYNLNISSDLFDSKTVLDAVKFNEQFKNIRIAVYECSSTGGSQWVLEDTISLGKFDMPHLKFNFDPKVLMNFEEEVFLTPQPSLSKPHVPSPAVMATLR